MEKDPRRTIEFKMDIICFNNIKRYRRDPRRRRFWMGGDTITVERHKE